LAISLAIRQWPLGYLGKGYKLRGQHVDPFSHCSICLLYVILPQKNKIWIKYMHYKKIISDNENINLKMPSFLRQSNSSKIKHFLARHDIHLPWARGQVLSYTSLSCDTAVPTTCQQDFSQQLCSKLVNMLHQCCSNNLSTRCVCSRLVKASLLTSCQQECLQ
jgi:hypothetical protein